MSYGLIIILILAAGYGVLGCSVIGWVEKDIRIAGLNSWRSSEAMNEQI